jgi:RNA polymerase sigma-70 factor (ECF subfamily)
MSESIHNNALAERLKNSDQLALAELQALFFKSLVYFTHQIMGDTEEAKSIVSESFMKLWKLRVNFTTFPDIRAFLYVSSRNSAYDYLRSAKKKSRDLEIMAGSMDDLSFPVPADEEIISNLVSSELYREMYLEISRLAPQQKRIIELLLEKKSYDEIAEIMKLSKKTVRNHTFRALKILRKNLGPLDKLPLFIPLVQFVLKQKS